MAPQKRKRQSNNTDEPRRSQRIKRARRDSTRIRESIEEVMRTAALLVVVQLPASTRSASDIESPSEENRSILNNDIDRVPEAPASLSVMESDNRDQERLVPQTDVINAIEASRPASGPAVNESSQEPRSNEFTETGTRNETASQERADSSSESQNSVSNPNSAPLGLPVSRNADEEDPWIAAFNDIAPASTRSGDLSIRHTMPVYTPFEIDMMEDLKLPDDVSDVRLPKIGNVQLLKLIDEQAKIYDGLDLVDSCFVTAREMNRQKHMRRLRLASRLSIPSGDHEEFKRISELLMPSKTNYEIFNGKINENDEAKLSYFWFELPNHGSLHAYVIERKRLPEIQSKDYFRQICQIVEFCHQRGIIIRDLKLRKFVFADARRQTVKFDDLDEVAICPENKADPELIDHDNFDVDDDRLCDRHGCPAYVSPEILDLSKKWYSGRASDVWSLGVLLYVLLVGRYPFYDVTPAGLFTKIRQARIHLTEQDGVRVDVRLLIRSMLRRDPKERPSVTEILAHPWLHPRDYRSSFKVFDSNEAVFWKSPSHGNVAATDGAAILARWNRSVVNSSTNGNAPRPPQYAGGAKVMERRTLSNTSGGNRQADN